MARPRVINPNGKTKITSVVLSADVHAHLKLRAIEQKITMGELIRRMIEAQL